MELQRHETIWHPRGHYDLDISLSILRRSLVDPCVVQESGAWWFAFHIEGLPVTLRVQQIRSDVHAVAFGPGADHALAALPRMLGADDDWSDFDSPAFGSTLPELVRRAREKHPGLRLPATGRILDVLIPAILEQKVTGKEAFGGYGRLISRYGKSAPTPHGTPTKLMPTRLRLAPKASDWLRIPSWAWHRAGVGPQRADTVMRALQRSSALERLAGENTAAVTRGLLSIDGIGPWTAAHVTQCSHGDPDSVAVGDYHLAAFVGTALTGESVDDAAMLELLEPWRGHRQRIVRLLYLSGVRKERHGARLSVRDYREI